MSDSIKVIEDFLDVETYNLVVVELGLQKIHDSAAEIQISSETQEELDSDVDTVRLFMP